ncbi:MAG TPA: PQQ-binding-like beta-propeller repeat protein, partial [Planctomycetaceae bacterium]|nr:PQQ-binding-like beta-propeller repeat protein [Planctomycetaceae bacterium]
VIGEARGLAVADSCLLVSTDAGAIYNFGPMGPVAEATVLKDTEADQFPVDAQSETYRTAATAILQQTGIKAGYCLVVGSEEGRLAYELAQRSDLKIYCVEPDGDKVARSRRRLSAAGLYGHRVVVQQQDLGDLPYSNYFADLIVSDTVFLNGKATVALKAIERHLKPHGGVICLGRPASAGSLVPDLVAGWTKSSDLGDQLAFRSADGWAMFTRGGLPGAGNWSHQYGNPGNTAVANDKRIQGDLGVLWYGDPGPGEMVNRHEGAVGPLSVNGRLFVQGETTIKAYDAYNGRHLWTHDNPKAVRSGVYQNQNPGNLAAGDDSLFHFIADKCYQVDMATGEIKRVHELPAGKNDGTHEWGYVAIQNGTLFGTATIRKELEAALRRRGKLTADATDGLFAIDIATGKHLWSYQGKSISHHTIAHGPDRVFFIDSSITSEQREELLRKDKSELARLTGKEQELAEERAKAADVRLTVALNAKTGEKLWEQAVDVTDCSDIGIGGGKLTMLYANDTLVLCGANANGHYWKQFVAGDFARRRMVALSAYDGFKLWAKDANYRHRPIIIGKQLLAEPWMFDLTTGEQQTRPHPITGEPVPWSIMRTGHHCGMLTGCDSGMIMFRSGYTGFFDLNADEGVRHFSGHRLGCWINAIAANGLIMIPEASAGCVCQFSIASTIVLEPREIRRPWTIYSAVGAQTPVKHLAINLGAPGDRKDSLGNIWFSYPRHKAYQETSLDVKLDLQ